tara:strand:+ start:43 stop:405 length:363 start_codon:yes stop_codon:yes gene_type:complete
MADTVYLLEGVRARRPAQVHGLGEVDLFRESEHASARYEWFTVGEQFAFEQCVTGCLHDTPPVGIRAAGGCGAMLGLGLLGGVLVGKKAGTLVTGAAVVAAALALRRGQFDFALDWLYGQ